MKLFCGPCLIISPPLHGAHGCLTSCRLLSCCPPVQGQGGVGQLGDGREADSGSPVRVAGGLTFKAISAGYIFSCALVAATGRPWCW